VNGNSTRQRDRHRRTARNLALRTWGSSAGVRLSWVTCFGTADCVSAWEVTDAGRTITLGFVEVNESENTTRIQT
jgi:hypothetical protein